MPLLMLKTTKIGCGFFDYFVEGCQFKPARMPLYMRLKDDGTGMHVGPIPHPGRRASHGCIRMPRVMAERFYSIVSVGTPVTIAFTT